MERMFRAKFGRDLFRASKEKRAGAKNECGAMMSNASAVRPGRAAALERATQRRDRFSNCRSLHDPVQLALGWVCDFLGLGNITNHRAADISPCGGCLRRRRSLHDLRPLHLRRVASLKDLLWTDDRARADHTANVGRIGSKHTTQDAR